MIVAGEFTPRQFEGYVPFKVDYGMMQQQAEMQQQYYDAFDELKSLSPNALTGDTETKKQYQKMVEGYSNEVENAYMNYDDLRLATRFMKTKAKDIGEQWKAGGKAYEINENYKRYHDWYKVIQEQRRAGKITEASMAKLVYDEQGFKTFGEDGSVSRFVGGERPDAIDVDKWMLEQVEKIKTDSYKRYSEPKKDGAGNIVYQITKDTYLTEEKIKETLVPMLLNAMSETGQLQDEMWYDKQTGRNRYTVEGYLLEGTKKLEEFSKSYDLSAAKTDEERYERLLRLSQEAGSTPPDKTKFLKDKKYRDESIKSHTEFIAETLEKKQNYLKEVEAKLNSDDEKTVEALKAGHWMSSYVNDLVAPIARGHSTSNPELTLQFERDHFGILGYRYQLEAGLRRQMLAEYMNQILPKPTETMAPVNNPEMNGVEEEVKLNADGTINPNYKARSVTVSLEKLRNIQNYSSAKDAELKFGKNNYVPVVITTTDSQHDKFGGGMAAASVKIIYVSKETAKANNWYPKEDLSDYLNNMINANLLPASKFTTALQNGKYNIELLDPNQAQLFKSIYEPYVKANKQAHPLGYFPPANDKEAQAEGQKIRLMLQAGNATVYNVTNGNMAPTTYEDMGLKDKEIIEFSGDVTAMNTFGTGPGRFFTVERSNKKVERFFIQSTVVRDQNINAPLQQMAAELAKKKAKADFTPGMVYAPGSNYILYYKPIIGVDKRVDFRALPLTINGNDVVGYEVDEKGKPKMVSYGTVSQLENGMLNTGALNTALDKVGQTQPQLEEWVSNKMWQGSGSRTNYLNQDHMGHKHKQMIGMITNPFGSFSESYSGPEIDQDERQ